METVLLSQVPTDSLFKCAIELNNIGVSLVEGRHYPNGIRAISEGLNILKTSQRPNTAEDNIVGHMIEKYSTFLAVSSLERNEFSDVAVNAMEIHFGPQNFATMRNLLIQTSYSARAQSSSPIRIMDFGSCDFKEYFDVVVGIVLYNLGFCLLMMTKEDPTNAILWKRTFQMLNCGLDVLHQSGREPMDDMKQMAILIVKANILSSLCHVSDQVHDDQHSAALYSAAFVETLGNVKEMLSILGDEILNNACAAAA